MRVPAVLDRPVPCGARWPANASVLSAGRRESGGQVAVQDPGQLPNRPTADPQVNVGVAETEITGLVEGGLVVVGQAGHARSSSYSSTAKVTARPTSRWTRELAAVGGS